MAAGYLEGAQPRLVGIEGSNTILPTSVFFDFDQRATLFGSVANRALIDGEYGRFMRALKSVLGTALMHEKRQLLNERLDFTDIIGRFLREVRQRAEKTTGRRFDAVLSGRPVHFHSDDPVRDAQARVDLEACYRAAGFEQVRFLPEPEAAALANHAHLSPGKIGLIVDIGGGTSDFTLFRARASGVEVITSHGVRVGGTDFDRQLGIDHVMPLLGLGSQIGETFGSRTMDAPKALFHDLATWQKIPFLYSATTRQKAVDLHRHASEPHKLARLVSVLENELGHDIAFAVERGKISANDGQGGAIDLEVLERGLKVPLSQAQLAQSLSGLTDRITACAGETLAMAGLDADQVDSLIFVGGSSLMHQVETAMKRLFSRATAHRASAFTAVIEGLALGLRPCNGASAGLTAPQKRRFRPVPLRCGSTGYTWPAGPSATAIRF